MTDGAHAARLAVLNRAVDATLREMKGFRFGLMYFIRMRQGMGNPQRLPGNHDPLDRCGPSGSKRVRRQEEMWTAGCTRLP